MICEMREPHRRAKTGDYEKSRTALKPLAVLWRRLVQPLVRSFQTAKD